MLDEEIVVPEFMAEAAYDAQLGIGQPTFGWTLTDEQTRKFYRRVVGAALKALAEHPIVPTGEQWRAILSLRHYGVSMDDTDFYIAEWQRRMFRRKPDPVQVQFHKLWTAAVGQPGYDKDEWLKLDAMIGKLQKSEKE